MQEQKIRLARCSECTLKERPLVHGQKGTRKDVIFIGEAPGADEARLGKPFVGAAGELLRDILSELEFNKDDFYISNSCLCHPVSSTGNNRQPTVDEIKCCNERLISSIKSINPQIVISLGLVAYYSLMGDFSQKMALMKMGTYVGNEYKTKDGIRIVATYHPAFALRSPSYKNTIKEHIADVLCKLEWEDICKDGRR